MRRLALLVPVLLALAGGVTACSDKTEGSPQVQSTTGGQTTGGPTTRTTTDTPTPASDLKGKDPCTLVTSSAQAQLGISGGEKSNVGSSRGCKWRLRGSDETTFFWVDIYDSQGIKDLPNDGDTTQLPKVGSHEAVQRTDPSNPGACGVVMGVTSSSRVTATALKGTDVTVGCELAMRLARLVEPELPRG